MSKLKTKADWFAYFEARTMSGSDISYRGGSLKIDITDLLPSIQDHADQVIGAYQNYLGGGIAGAIIGAAMFDPAELTAKDRKVFEKALDMVKQYFYHLNNGGGDEYMQENYNSYARNQNLPARGY